MLKRVEGGDTQNIAFQLARQAIVLENDVERLIPRHIVEHDCQRAMYIRIENHVQSTNLMHQTEEILQVHVFEIDRNRLTGVLGTDLRTLLRHLRSLFSRHIDGWHRLLRWVCCSWGTLGRARLRCGGWRGRGSGALCGSGAL